MSIIALATDFGEGQYVGQMKGVILSRAPSARIVDLFHSVSAQSILEGAFLLSRSWKYFPEKTIFVSVVDPGVGSARRILAVSAHRRTFLAPDNGLLSFLPPSSIDEIRLVENRSLFLPEVSNTFHGRDIFAPVAAALSRSLPPARLGRRIGILKRIADFFPRRAGNVWKGVVVHIDRFGNAVTNIPAGPRRVRLRVGRKYFGTNVRAYFVAPPRRPVVIQGSFDTWEIAIQNGDAARRLGLRVGLPVSAEAVP